MQSGAVPGYSVRNRFVRRVFPREQTAKRAGVHVTVENRGGFGRERRTITQKSPSREPGDRHSDEARRANKKQERVGIKMEGGSRDGHGPDW